MADLQRRMRPSRASGAVHTLQRSPATLLPALARLAMLPPAEQSVATLSAACELVREALGAEDAYVMRAGDPHFQRIGAESDPEAYEAKQKGYFLVWRELAKGPRSTGCLFDTMGRYVERIVPLAAGVPATHAALLLPGDESLSEMLVVRGPWPAGLTQRRVDFLAAAQPMLAYLVSSLLDAQRWARQREQLHSLGRLAATLLRGESASVALTAVATALAKASGFDWVTLTLVNETLDTVTARVLNQARHSNTEIAAISRDGALHRAWALEAARHMARSRRPLLYPDLSAPGHELPLSPALQQYYERAHILSMALFPLWSSGRLIGLVSYSSTAPRAFAAAEIDFLAALNEQAVLAVEWLALHRRLHDANAALAHAATHDALTDLPNRALFLDRLSEALVRARYTGRTLAVLFLDLDDFKSVNDRFGHDAGDVLLRTVAERLQHALRTSDLAARFGGDEFTVLLEEVADEAMAYRIATRLRAAMEQPVLFEGHHIQPRVSIGVICSDAADLRPEDLLRRADEAMYRDKALAKARRLQV
jgi:diguanylate cyclase (GGDEF)-like protein